MLHMNYFVFAYIIDLFSTINQILCDILLRRSYFGILY